MGFNLGKQLKAAARNVGESLDHLSDEAVETAAQLIDHPAYLAAGPAAPLLAQLNKRGAFKGITGLAEKAGLRPDIFRGPRSPRTPTNPFRPNDEIAPHPSDYLVERGATTCTVGGAGKPFCLNGFKALAAGAQTQGTDLVNFHAAASNPTIIATDNIIPGSVDIRTASLSISARAVTTLGFEGVGFFEQFYLVEYINGIEWARWSMRSLATMAGFTGSLGAAFGQSNTYALSIPAIPFPRKYDPNTPYKTALQLSVTTTTVNILDCSFVENGYRP